eukprot:493794_1
MSVRAKCAAGCGFYGNEDTKNYCSLCFEKKFPDFQYAVKPQIPYLPPGNVEQNQYIKEQGLLYGQQPYENSRSRSNAYTKPNKHYRYISEPKVKISDQQDKELNFEAKYPSDIDYIDNINDGYKYVKRTDTLLASHSKRVKQNDSNKSSANQIMNTLTQIARGKETDKMQKCIGQVAISYDGDDEYYYGTGTVYKHLDSKYYLVITCAHNLIYSDDRNNKQEKAKKIFYLAKGIKCEKIRLTCIEWIVHEQYNADLKHCPNDIGIILCKDSKKYYKKQKINVNELIRIDSSKKNELENCNVFGYPVKCEGQLMGKMGTVNKDHKYKEWKYSNIETYPGQSGSPLYKVEKPDDNTEIITIYGIHTFGNIQQNVNRGVYLDKSRIKWIKNKERYFVQKRKKEQQEA